MIKNKILEFRNKIRVAYKEHTTYLKSTHIGILYNAGDFDFSIISDTEKNLTFDGKKVVTIGFANHVTENSLLFTSKDISTIGKIKKESLKNFINQPFDFLIALDISGNDFFKYILASSKALCKIGFDTEEHTNILQMAIKMESDKTQAVTTILKYLKMIS